LAGLTFIDGTIGKAYMHVEVSSRTIPDDSFSEPIIYRVAVNERKLKDTTSVLKRCNSRCILSYKCPKFDQIYR
jgi:hypothetical protein